MSREILVNITPRESRAALVENGVLQELIVDTSLPRDPMKKALTRVIRRVR